MMKKKLYANAARIFANLMPCIRGGGGRVMRISEDFRELTVRLPLTWRTRNIVGTIFGGSLYASTDPFFMLMLREILGKDFVVWDKGCTIRFKRPAKETVFAEFRITDEMLATLRADLSEKGETTFTWPLEYRGQTGIVYVEFEKVLYVATKEVYDEKSRRRINRDRV